jgi:hypothetical protein
MDILSMPLHPKRVLFVVDPIHNSVLSLSTGAFRMSKSRKYVLRVRGFVLAISTNLTMQFFLFVVYLMTLSVVQTV